MLEWPFRGTEDPAGRGCNGFEGVSFQGGECTDPLARHPMTIPLLLALSSLPAQEVETVVATVLDEFASHRVVAIGENHGHRELHDLVVALLEHPDAVGVIDDIAVEWGNSLYQGVTDRYVRGESVPWDSVTMAWRNTIVSPNTVWFYPVSADG